MKKEKLILTLLATALTLALVANCGDKSGTDNANSTASDMDEITKKGQEQFVVNCSSCHGMTGAGDGPAAASINPKPRNYKAPAKDWKNGNTEEGILKTLNNGSPGTSMVAYKHLGEENLKALAKYVIYLQTH